MPDINPILASVKSANVSIAAGKGAISENYSKISESYNADAVLQRQNAESGALIESVKQAGQLQYDVAMQKNALDIGTDIGDATGLYSALSKQYIQSKAAQNKALDRIQEKSSVSFFDDPLQYVINQFTIDDDINAHNAAERKANLASGQISEINLLTDQRAISAKKLQTTVTEASANAAVSEVRNKANILADGYAREALLQNTAGIEKLTAMSEMQIRNASAVFSAQAQQENIKIAQEHLALSRQEFDFKRLEKEKGEAVGQYVSDTIIQGYKAMYPNNPDKWIAPNSPKLLAFISNSPNKPPLSGEMLYAFERGELNSRAANPDGSNRLLADSAADFVRGLKYGVQTGTDAKVVKDLIVDTARGVVGSTAYKKLDPKDRDGQERLINDTVDTTLKNQAALVKDPSNPYYLSNVDQIVKQNPGLQTFPLWKNILEPLATAGVNLDPNTTFHLGMKAVEEEKITLNKLAVDLSTMYKRGQQVNIQSKQMIPMGLAPEEAYRVKIDTGSITRSTVNMADPADIIKAAMRLNINTKILSQADAMGN